MTHIRDDAVLVFTRVLGWCIAPVLVLAFVLLWPVPTDTGQRFAWNITPTMTPMVLASAYLGGAYYFARVGIAGAWHPVKGGLAAVTTFASLLGVATIIHWDKFSHSSPAFYLWAALYFTAPVLVALAYLRNRRREAPARGSDVQVPMVAARSVAVIGVLTLATGLLLFALPTAAISVWPWALSPLTARVMGAVFCLGLAGIGAVLDRRWDSARILVQVGIVMVALIVISGIRARTELLTDRPLTWIFVIGFPILAVAMVAWYISMERRGER